MEINRYPLYVGYSALIGTSEEGTVTRAISRVEYDGEAIVITRPDIETMTYEIDSEDITKDKNTGRISFRVYNTDYLIREFRDSDGIWLSRYKTPLPVEALEERLAMEEDANQMSGVSTELPNEQLTAYTLEDSAYVLGLVYTNGRGQWIRTGEDWVLMASDDTTYTNMLAIPIAYDSADEYIKLYDSYYVTVETTEKYEEQPATELPANEVIADEALEEPVSEAPTQ